MIGAIAYRGPDDSGVWSDEQGGIALGHRRLSIIDLSPAGHQPMLSRSGRYVLTFNGEVYNHRDLRRELEARGTVAWRGSSDTETLLELIERHGLAAALKRAVGMFALALWDRQERTLSLARDRLGEKPLYFGWLKDGFAFASELKALRATPGFAGEIDPNVVSLYLRRGYAPAPWSIFRHVYKLMPASILKLDRDAIRVPPATAPLPGADAGLPYEHYWSAVAVTQRPPAREWSQAEAIDRLEGALTTAVREQAVADVPVGAFLSGGVDSSAIVSLMKRGAGADVRTFTIGFEDPAFDEAPFARAVAEHLGTDHTEMRVSSREVREIIPGLPEIYDEPFADSSGVPTYMVSRLARQSVTVALSGDGGDELFAGYNRYRAAAAIRARLRPIPLPMRRVAARALSLPSPATWDRLATLRRQRTSMLGVKVGKLAGMLASDLTARSLYGSVTDEWRDVHPALAAPALTPIAKPLADPVESMMLWDLEGYLPDDILTKVDRASMANSLETRAPFLDHRVVELAWQIPLGLKLRNGTGKWILRELLYRHVPRALIERPKAGFAMPIGQWLRGPLAEWAESLIGPDALKTDPLLDPEVIGPRWRDHREGGADWTASLWSVLMYRAWATAGTHGGAENVDLRACPMRMAVG